MHSEFLHHTAVAKIANLGESFCIILIQVDTGVRGKVVYYMHAEDKPLEKSQNFYTIQLFY